MAQAKRVSKHYERRWIILFTDGTQNIVGRHTDPTDDEIAVMEARLKEHGVSGWLAISAGDYYGKRSKMDLMMVRPLNSPAVGFDTAAAAYQQLRQERLKG
jgi:hypothetical protein